MKLRYAALSDKGRMRHKNEDNWYANAEQGIFVVSDGIGGAIAGDWASRIVVETLPLIMNDRVTNYDDLTDFRIKDIVNDSVIELNHKLYESTHGKPGLDGMGATLVVALIRSCIAIIAHMGDSRAYIVRRDSFECLTKDHSIIQLLIDSGDITDEQAANHPARGQLTRFVGMPGEAIPQVSIVQLYRGNRILLCSDGLTDMVGEQEIETILRKRLSADAICDRLIKKANAEGGKDNITALVVFCS